MMNSCEKHSRDKLYVTSEWIYTHAGIAQVQSGLVHSQEEIEI